MKRQIKWVLCCPDCFSFWYLFRDLDCVRLLLVGSFWSAFFWRNLGRFLLASGYICGFPLCNFLPSFNIFFLNRKLGAVSLEVAMFLAISALERQVFIIQFLVMSPRSDFYFYCLRETGFQVNFNANSGTGVLAFVISFVNEVSDTIPYSL